MTVDELFALLDVDRDGRISRADVRAAAEQLGWHWPEAPIYAVLDNLLLRESLSHDAFVECLREIAADRHGPYGRVLRRSPVYRRGDPGSTAAPGAERSSSEDRHAGPAAPDALPAALARLAGSEVAAGYRRLLDELTEPPPRLDRAHSALLVIDPQRSFTRGAWKRSAGAGADQQVEPIRLAFARAGQLLRQQLGRVETLFTRCPFPPDSYDWDPSVAEVLPSDQLYFVKPGNSALWPPTNGYRHWLDDLAERGKRVLVMGGCTLNSCVRVSSIETQLYAEPRGLRVLVDLELCGARTANYAPSPEFAGRSSVESAVREMRAAGVEVTAGVQW